MTTATRQIRYPIDARAERILSAALDEFSRRGFAGAREGVIARRAGVALATLKLYFPDKDELFREVIRSTVVATLEPKPDRPVAATAGRERLKEFADSFWRAMDQPGQAAMLRLSMGELPRFPELALFHATEVIGRAASRLEQSLTEGVARGEFRVPDPRATARVILSALITHAHWFSLPDIHAGLIGADRARAEAAVVEVLADALRTPRADTATNSNGGTQ